LSPQEYSEQLDLDEHTVKKQKGSINGRCSEVETYSKNKIKIKKIIFLNRSVLSSSVQFTNKGSINGRWHEVETAFSVISHQFHWVQEHIEQDFSTYFARGGGHWGVLNAATPQKINEHRITTTKVNQTQSSQHIFLAT